MSNVEAAASLFGTLDSSVDPFDSIGNDENGLQGTQHALSPSNDNAASQSNALHTAYSAERGQLLDLSYTIEEQPNPSFSAQTNGYLTTEVNSYHSVNGGLTHEHNYDDRWQVYESDYQSTDYQRAATSGEASQNFSSDSNYPSAYGVDNNSYPMYHDGSLSTMGSTGQRGQSYETEGSRQYGEYNSQVYQSTYEPSKCSNTNLYETYAVNPPSREKSLDVPRVNSQVLLEGRASTSNHRPASYSAYDPPVPSSKSSRVRRIQEGSAMSSNTSYSLSSTDSRDHVGHFAEGDRRSADQNASWTYGESYGGNNHHGNIHRSFTASNVGNDVVQVEQYSEEPGELIQASNAYQSAPSQESNTQPQLMSSYLTSDDTHGGTLHRVTNEGMTFTNQRDRQDFYSTTPYGQSRRNLGGNVVSKSPEMFENGLRSNDETDESYFEQQRGSISHNSHPYVTIQHSSTSTRSRRLSEDSSSLAASIPLPISPNIIPKSHFTLSNGDMPSQHFGHSSQNIQNYNVEFSMAEHASDGQLIFHPQSEETLRVGLPLASDTRPILNAPPDTFLEEMLSDDIYSSNSRQDFTDSFEPQLLYSGTQDQYAGDSSKNHFSLHPPPARNGASSRQYLLPDSTSYSYIDTNASQSNTRVDEQFVSHSNTFRPEKNYDINGLSASFEKMDVAGHPSASPPMSLKSDRFSNTTSLHDPYAPAHLYPPTETFVYDHRPLPSNEDGTGFIEVSDIPSMSHNTYAPSPSLLGSNDPLERTRYKVPVVSFGFGGKLVTCFHNPPVTGTGFDIALSERRSTVIQVYPLRRLVSFSSDDSENFFPGPLLGDQGLSAASIVRAGLNNTVKTKKARVLTYLERRIGDASRDLGYLPQGSPSRQQAADKLTMMRLLKVMLDNDGQVSGSPQIDAAVREVLLGISKENFASSHYASEPIRGLGSYQTLPHRDETPVATYQVWSSVLEKLQDLLLQGEKRQAYRYALEEKLWAHAMIISSSLDKDSFQSVVNEFIASELGLQNGKTQTILSHDGVGAVLENSSAVNGRESLRVAYSLFSGQGSSSVQELLAPKHTLRALEIRPTKSGSAFPLVPEIPTSTLSERIPFNVLSKWNETAAIIYSGQMGMDSSLALTALGDHLTNSDWVYAAHCCYLLSPRSSPFGGISVPSARITLLGYQTHQWMPLFWRDSEFIIWSEIAEFALSLHTPAKGQESFLGFPHLLVYRLLWAERLAEYGDLAAAKRYCECIHASLNRATPYNCPSLVENLKELSDRITGESTSEKGSSWITGRIAKPNLDSIGDWLGKGLSRFVAGEGDPSLLPGNEETVNSDGNFSGAFSQFSTISSTENSIVPSPASSLLNVNVQSVLLDQKIPPVLSPLEVQKHSGRAVSAMDYYRPSIRQASPGPRVASASAATTKFGPEALHNEYSASSSNAAGNIDASIENTTTNGGLNDNEELGSVKRSNSWWGSTAEVADSTGTTPVAATFYRFEAPASQSAGFISLMDSNQLQPSVISPSANISISKIPEEEGDDDLGLGNDSTKKKPIEKADQRAVEANKEEPAPPPSNVRNSGSWLGRWWSRDSSTPKPIKASLGEETSFYYDKELKKWVNKKAGVESQPATPPPPPPPARAQTASPSRNATRVSSNSPGTGLPPPPVRPASVAEVGLSLPRKQEDRKRSNLVPPEVNTSLSHDAGHALSGHSKPSGSKRNLRSRYVDVFQQ